MKEKAIQFAALFLLLLTTGVFWGTWFTMTRSIEEFSSAEFIHIGKVIIANVANPMRFIMPGCILLLIVYSWMSYGTGRMRFYFIAASLALMLVSLLITLLVEVPIDNEIKTWTATTIPGNWTDIRERWAGFHTLRTLTSLGSFACFGIGILSPYRARVTVV